MTKKTEHTSDDEMDLVAQEAERIEALRASGALPEGPVPPGPLERPREK